MVGRCCTTKSKGQSERLATKRCLDTRGWEGSVWECGTCRGAILAESCCVATAMGEWGQAGDDRWEGGGEGVMFLSRAERRPPQN